ncbi:hypothetical protein [Actinoplanes regularis]|uniref:hypothetical protein n=1 Tax=Actinoplanes regularis TaxID=52697 RepID=UPI0015C6259A|nr:hypothetical protein [Actinoplanes regularis]
MADGYDLVVQISGTDADREEPAVFARRLRAELLDLDVDAVDPLADATVPDGAKGVSALAGALGVRLGAAGLASTFAKIRNWVSRTERSVEVTIDGDTIKVTGVTATQQEELINVWLSRHAPRP